MTKYKYHILKAYTAEENQNTLNILARDGWRVVGAISGGTSGPSSQIILEREVR